MADLIDQPAKRYCPRCRKTLSEKNNFYTYRDGRKAEFCKACQTAHINNWDPDTFVPLLKDFDVPYVPAKWKSFLDRAVAKDPKKITGMSVFGKYLSSMKIKPWNQYTFADTERLMEKEKQEAEVYGTPEEQIQKKIDNMRESLENGEITEGQFQSYVDLYGPQAEIAPQPQSSAEVYGEGESANGFISNSPFENVEIPDVSEGLTEEDKIYLAMRWGRLYSAADWVYLEEKYKEYDESFDLHNADLKSGTIQLCKLDLKLNQAIDAGDVDTYAKLSRAYDSLRKSLKFTEAQRKEDKSTEFSGYGQIVAYCEKETGFIPRLETKTDRDIADKDLHDMKAWVRDLVESDPAIFKQIEQYIKKREIAEEQERDQQLAEENGDEQYVVTDEDFADYTESIHEQRAEDAEVAHES